MKICVLGLGYIGLPTASVLATAGHEVVGVDVNARVVELINHGQIHIEEKGLKTLFGAAVRSGNLTASRKPVTADAFILCVPTPETDHRADLTFLVDAAKSVAPVLKKGNLLVVESTIPPGATEKVVLPELEKTKLEPGKDYHVAHCPERVLPGSILKELVENDRVIGGLTPACAKRAAEVYGSFVQGRIAIVDLRTAETVKLVENSFRDVNIAFANTVSNIALEMGIDSEEVIRCANMHPRVNILKPGPGVGGHCIPIDPWFLVEAAPAATALLKAARRVNDDRPVVMAKILKKLVGRVRKPKVAILGVSYKGDVDDTPADIAIDALEKFGIDVAVYDPHVKIYRKDLVTLEQALAGADAAAILSAHSDFKYLAPDRVGGLMRARRLLDPFHIVDLAAWREAGFEVVTV
ncbi:MAG: nucleotide sugar dehydrogenase [Deltaproteobacteria bacterium]|nr:nucleotide sugar dehydrogenase [Deltaproteobacteria bacterium]